MVRYLTRRGDRGSLCPVRSLAQTGHELVVVADSIDFCFEGSWFESRSSVRQGPVDSPYWLCDWVPRQPSPVTGTGSCPSIHTAPITESRAKSLMFETTRDRHLKRYLPGGDENTHRSERPAEALDMPNMRASPPDTLAANTE